MNQVYLTEFMIVSFTLAKFIHGKQLNMLHDDKHEKHAFQVVEARIISYHHPVLTCLFCPK